jgi:MFS transporter, FHS family, L-fucose permease
LIFSLTVGKLPARANEISGLMMMAVSGGAVIPFLTGYAMSIHISAGMYVLLGCAVYLLIISFRK